MSNTENKCVAVVIHGSSGRLMTRFADELVADLSNLDISVEIASIVGSAGLKEGWHLSSINPEKLKFSTERRISSTNDVLIIKTDCWDRALNETLRQDATNIVHLLVSYNQDLATALKANEIDFLDMDMVSKGTKEMALGILSLVEGGALNERVDVGRKRIKGRI